MTKEVAPVSLTGGAGYGFEDQVAAWFLMHLLCGKIPFGLGFGIPVAIDFQVRESGWLLDDLLITGRDSEGVTRRTAVSVKRHRQVTQGGFPSDFVEAVWEQWLSLDIPENPFRSEYDSLCLVTGQLAGTVKSAWDEILRQSLVTDPKRLASRLTTRNTSNKVQRALFASLRCPGNLAQIAKVKDIDTATVSLLPHIQLLHLDFRSSPSHDLKSATHMCQMCLKKGSLKEALGLWGGLVAIAAELRPRGGSVDLPQLLRRLGQHSFQDHPNYRADWNTLKDLSAEAMATIRTQLGPGITIPRASLVNNISVRLEASGMLVLLGESGSGKSALAKSIGTSESYQQAIWLDRQHLEGRGLDTVRRSLKLDNSLTEILPSLGDKRTLLVLDALESFSERALRNAVELIQSLGPDVKASRWRVLMTSQPLHWGRVQLQLHRCGFQLSQESILQVELPDSGSLEPVTRALPSLRHSMLQPELRELLRNLKILDWVASTISSSPTDNSKWIGLSDIIDSVWLWWIQSDHNRYSRDKVLKKVGVEETRSFSGTVPLDRLTMPDMEILTDLEDRGILNVQEGKVSFSHDLLGDWSRLQTLIAIDQSNLPGELRDRTTNPRWHTAIRLYGLRTLEHAPDSNPWFQLIQQLNDDSDRGQLAADLVLEAVAFASNAYRLLERVWPHLSAEEGSLLKRLLRRFRHSASFPDPRMVVLTSSSDLGVWMASSMRIPIWPYWEPMLALLHTHAHEVKRLALKPASELCRLWLSQMPTHSQDGKPFPWRHYAAELALTLAREVQGLRAEKGIVHGKAYESVYEAFLYAAPDLPEQVSALALELAKRRPPAPEIRKRVEESERRRAEEHENRLREDPKCRARLAGAIPPSPSPFGLEIRQDPWPAGPMEKVDEAFREACLKKGALLPLITKRPEIAREVILALCIEPPQCEMYQDDPIFGMRYGTAWANGKAMFFTGPFFTFLQINPGKAIELIIELVDFAAERWRDWAEAKDGIIADPQVSENQSVDVWINNSKHELIGDSRVLGWYRGRLIDAPYVVSALMALEKWLYDKIEADENISKWVELILKHTQSVAPIGVLVALGKKHPKLFLDYLKPLLTIWQVYQWDLAITVDAQVIAGFPLMLWVSAGEEAFNIVRDWHEMPHRKIHLRNLVIQMLLSYPELQHYFDNLREKWRSTLESTGASPDSIAYLIERFDPANYRLHENEDGQRIIVLEWPEYLREGSQVSLNYSSFSLALMSLPTKCREILDSKTQLDESELEELWHTLQYLVDEFDEYGDSIEYLDNAVTAGIAVLLILHAEWLEANEEKADWCLRQLKQVRSTDHPQKSFDFPGSVFNTRWEIFLGEIAVHFLAQDHTNENLRFLTAQSVLAYHYDTTEFVFRAAWQNRQELGEEFDRLLNLGRLWAGIRWGLNWCQSRQMETRKLLDWRDITVQSFVNQNLQSIPISLTEVARRSKDLIRDAIVDHKSKAAEVRNQAFARYVIDNEVPSRHRPGLDWQVIQAVYAWLPPLAESSSARERKTWIAIFEELLQLELTYIQTTPRDKWGKVEGTPHKFEYWVFEVIASLIPQLREDEHPQNFWRPILDLGGTAHYWVESFLSRWFMTGSRMASEPAEFVRHWQSMIEYVLESPLWQNDPSTPGGFYLDGLYIHLMGLGFAETIFDQEDYTDVLAPLLPLYERWAGEWLRRARVAEAFARFLVKPAAGKPDTARANLVSPSCSRNSGV